MDEVEEVVEGIFRFAGITVSTGYHVADIRIVERILI